jgi:subtilisin family serine protease
MKKILFGAIAMAGLVLYSCQKDEIPLIEEQTSDVVKFSSQVIEGKFIILFEDEGLLKSASVGGIVGPEAVLQTTRDIFTLMEMPMREPDFVYSSALRGIAVEMSNTEAMKVAQAPGVKGVYPDMWITVDLPKVQGKPSKPAPSGQTTPWGITRVGGGATYTGTAKAWIIDTGVDLDHPDLNVNTTLDKDVINNDLVADDDNGHGTHCAGIVAAKNNTVGVVGVAAGAQVVPVKVLDRRGSGAYSVIIAGVDYVKANASAGDVANMSLGGGVYTLIDNAVIALGAAGIKVALAAGNESDNANNHSPARANGANLYTVSSMAQGDLWSSFSNYGNPPIEFCAPGSSIYSTYKGGGYATLNGTSMAAPHVCGLLLLGTPKTDGTVIGDPDGNPDPIAHM